MGRLKQLDEQLNGIKAQEEELRGQLAEIREREQEKSSDIPALIQERDECRCGGRGGAGAKLGL